MRTTNGNIRPAPLILTVLTALLFVCTVGLYAGGGAPHTKTTQHYVIKTDISEDFARIAARHMDLMYGEYERRFSSFDLAQANRATIKVFRRRRRYDSAVPEPLRGTLGCFSYGENLLMSFKGDRTREDVLRTLSHEGFHQFLYDRIGGNMPVWLNEGFAEYFAEAERNGDGFKTGQIPVERLRAVQSAVRSDTFIPLDMLFPMRRSKWVANVRNDARMTGLQYDQAWSVIHFLMHAGEGRFRDRLYGYLRSHADGQSPGMAFKENFGTNIRAMERAWREYIINLRPTPVTESEIIGTESLPDDFTEQREREK